MKTMIGYCSWLETDKATGEIFPIHCRFYTFPDGSAETVWKEYHNRGNDIRIEYEYYEPDSWESYVPTTVPYTKGGLWLREKEEAIAA